MAKYDSVKSSIENKKMECLENIKNCLPNIVEQAKNSEPNSIKGLINSLDSYKNEVNMIKDNDSSKIINEKEIINNEIDKTYKILQEKEINFIE